jgi:hypothetical protein
VKIRVVIEKSAYEAHEDTKPEYVLDVSKITFLGPGYVLLYEIGACHYFNLDIVKEIVPA